MRFATAAWWIVLIATEALEIKATVYLVLHHLVK
jgi:hypothetical protein